jgi:threonine dehydrogenase-like Zn-dependent dehydrogenase
MEIADVPEPTAGDSVLIRALQVGICGTDVKILTGKIPVEYPRIMGHEMVGEVV